MKVKVIAVLAMVALCFNGCNSSAIPMWEFLSKEQKVSEFIEMPFTPGDLNTVLCFIKRNFTSFPLSLSLCSCCREN